MSTLLKNLIIFSLLLFLACEENQGTVQTELNTSDFKTKSFYANNIVQRRVAPVLGNSVDTVVIGTYTYQDDNNNDLYRRYSRAFFEFNALDTNYIDKSNGTIVNRITQPIKFKIRVDKQLSADDENNSGMNQLLTLKLINETYVGDTLYINESIYWSAHRMSEAVDNGATVIDLAQLNVESGSSELTEYTFEISPDDFVDHFLNEDTIPSFRALMLDAPNLTGSIRIDTLPMLQITYNDTSNSEVTDDINAISAKTWINYDYLGNNINSDYTLRGGDRESLVFEFDSDEIIDFLDDVVPFGASFSAEYSPLSQFQPESILRQTTAYSETEIGRYNDGLDFGFTFNAGFFAVEQVEDNRLKNDISSIGSLVSQVLNSWENRTTVLQGKLTLEVLTSNRPGILHFPRPLPTDTIYRLNIFYIEKQANQ